MLVPLMVVGCGGGRVNAPSDGGGGILPSSEVGTARFHVDVPSGQVSVLPLTESSDEMNTAAILTGTAVHFDSTVLYDQPGSTGLKVLDVSLANKSGLGIGREVNGTDVGLRVLFSAITPVSSASDVRTQVAVSRLSFVPDSPVGVAAARDGSVYVSGSHRIVKIRNGVATAFAGGSVAGTVEGLGTAARFDSPMGLAVNPVDGALIVADNGAHRLRRVDAAGTTSLIAGTGVDGGANGAGNVATFSKPVGVAVDANGVIYVAEQTGNRIRRVTCAGDPTLATSYTVSTLAGSGAMGSADGVGTAATFYAPRGLGVAADGNVYVADSGNRRVRLIRPGGQVITIAGTGVAGGADGTGDGATFNYLFGLVVMPDRGRGPAIVVSDFAGHNLRQLRLKDNGTASPGNAANWIVQSLAGMYASSGAVDGLGDAARFNAPKLIANDSAGNLYVADSGNGSVRQVQPNEGFFPVGTPTGASGEEVRLCNPDSMYTIPDGATKTQYPVVNYPSLQVDEASAPIPWTFLVPEGVTAFEFTVRVEGPMGVTAPPEARSGLGSPRVFVRHLAGGSRGFVDGPGTAARFDTVCGLAELDGYFYVADYGNHSIRRVDRDGTVSTIAGVQGAGAGSANGNGNVAKFDDPGGMVALSGADCPWPGDPRAVYLITADDATHRVRMLCTPTYGSTPGADWRPGDDPAQWQVATIAGSTAGCTDGRGDAALFNYPGSVAALNGRTVYVSEYMGNRVRMLQWTGGSPMDPTHWQVSTVAGDTSSGAGLSGTADGTGPAARFNAPFGMAVSREGNVFVADMYNHRIRRITPDRAVTTLAGSTSGYADATGASARFWEPRDLAIDSAGYLYVADRSNRRIRRVSPTGVVTTVAGTGASDWRDGRGDVATFDQPNSICITSSGDLCLGDHNVSLGNILRLVERVFDLGRP